MISNIRLFSEQGSHGSLDSPMECTFAVVEVSGIRPVVYTDMVSVIHMRHDELSKSPLELERWLSG